MVYLVLPLASPVLVHLTPLYTHVFRSTLGNRIGRRDEIPMNLYVQLMVHLAQGPRSMPLYTRPTSEKTVSRTSENSVWKLSEKSLRCSEGGLTGYQNRAVGTF